MTDNQNQFQPYRYSQQPDDGRPSLNISASRAPQPQREREPSGGFATLMKRPLVATAALLITAGVFAAIIVFSYPDSDDASDNVPIVSADATPFRDAAQQPGGMSIANADSTIYQQMRTSNLDETPPVENLLDLEQPVSKDAVIAAASPAEEIPTSIEKAPEGAMQSGTPTAGDAVVASAETPAAAELKDPVAAAPAAAPAEGAPAISAPAQSPETLAFVKSVLDEKKAEEAAATTTAAAEPAPATPAPAEAEKVAAVQPAAGTPSTAPVSIDAGGTHYVQLASVSSSEGAEKEWGKIKSQYSVLGQAQHRVKTADLGAKGVFYRIQAGPFSKDKANKVCESIKAQKPGGCLVVQ